MNKPVRAKKSIFTRKYFIILTVCIVAGFIIGYSYNLSKDNQSSENTTNYYFQQQENYRSSLIEQQEKNRELLNERNELEEKVREYEKKLATSETDEEDQVKDAEKLRLTLGQIASEGKGITVTLQDGEYNPELTNPNDYIVHEGHIFALINELKMSGAEAIAINGQRLKANSYIVCNGPVITIDGKQFPAPFIVEVIGEQDVLKAAIELPGGVMDQLLNDNIVVTIENNDLIEMTSILKDS